MDARKHAQMILGVRGRPNWLLVSLILSSVMVAEGLPLILSHLFPPGSWAAFAISTLCVTVIGEILPQAIMPLFVLEVAGRMMWFVKALMWLMAIPGVLFAYPLRLFKTLKKKRHPYKMDGILEVDELIEFIRLHEKGEGLGGNLEDGVGCIARMMMVQQEDVKHWKSVTVVHADPQGSSTTFQRHTNVDSVSDDILSPMTEGSRISSNGTTRGLRRRTNRSSEPFAEPLSENGNTALEPYPTKRGSTVGRLVDRSSCQHEDRPLGDIPLNQASTTSSRQRLPLKFDQVDGPSLLQVDRLSFCNMANGLLRQKERSTSGQWVKAIIRDLDTLTSGQSAISALNQNSHCSSQKKLWNNPRSASTGTIPESQDPSSRANASFWTSGHMPRTRHSVYSYFNMEDMGMKVSKKSD